MPDAMLLILIPLCKYCYKNCNNFYQIVIIRKYLNKLDI